MVEKMTNVFQSKELGLNSVYGRELYEGLKVPETTKFADGMHKQLKSVDAIEGIDFFVLKRKSTGGRESFDYIIALDIAKEICMVVGAAPRTNKETKRISKEMRRYFIECERQLSKAQKEQVEQLLEKDRNRTVTVHERNVISSSVNLKADESKNSRDEAKKIKNFIFNKYGIKSYGEIKQVDIPMVLQIVNKWEVSDRKNNLFNLIG